MCIVHTLRDTHHTLTVVCHASNEKTMRNNKVLLLIAIFISTACTDNKFNANMDEGIKQDSVFVRSLANQLSQAARDHDVKKMMELYADSITLLMPGRASSIVKRDSLERGLQLFFDDTSFAVTQLDRQIVDLKISTGLAVVQSAFRDQYIYESHTNIIVGKDIIVWELLPNGHWKITLMMNDEFNVQ